MAITLPDLPYPKEALAPHISEKTLELHHGKHHNTYVTNTNKLIGGTELANESLQNIIRATAGDKEKIGIFNNAAQVWNHSFYWKCMNPSGGGSPSGLISEKITSEFGGYNGFIQKFKDAALTQFGSGWAWLVLKDQRLEIIKTSNADTPIAYDLRTLLTIDVWEHAYYLDYQNRRADYIDTFVENLINWDFVNSNLG